MSELLYLPGEALEDLATPAEYVDAVREGYRQRGEGAPAEPRTRLDSADPPGFLTGYFALLPETGVMGGYTYSAGFSSRDAHFLLPLYDADSGEPLAVLDGAPMNPYKTGATGAVATDALARGDASTLGLLGSGTQARSQLLATATVRNLEAVRVYSPTADHRRSFAAEFDDRLAARVEAVGSSEAAVSGADIVVTATSAREPVLDATSLDPGTHVTAMGQYHPEHREIDAETVARAAYVPDLRGRLEQDAGAYIRALEAGAIEQAHARAELGEVVAGVAPGRESDAELTLFDSGGTAIETVAAAAMLFERARDRGRGRPLELTPASEAFAGR